MTWLDLAALLCAGAAAGLINTVVGSGTLITFPTLLALGVPPVIANISNTVGLTPGSLSGAWATGRELTGERRRVLWLGTASLLGGVVGAMLLLWLPSAAFDTIVPVLIGIGCVLVVLQPFISTKLAIRRARLGLETGSVHGPIVLWLAIALVGVYGGYFGAAQGVLLIAILGIGLAEPLLKINAIKNVLATIANAVASIVFIIVSEVNWPAAIAIAVGSVLGAQVGGRVGRKLPATIYRVIIVAVGIAAIISLDRELLALALCTRLLRRLSQTIERVLAPPQPTAARDCRRSQLVCFLIWFGVTKAPMARPRRTAGLPRTVRA